MPPAFFLNCSLKKNKKASSLQMVPLNKWPTFQMGFCGAPPTLSWPKWGWPKDSRSFCCIVLMQSKWHSSGPFSCSSPPQNTLLLFLPVGLACINSSTFRLIWWQMKTDTGGQRYDYLLTGQPFTSVSKSFEQFQFNPEKLFTSNDIYPYIQEYIYTGKIGTYVLFIWYILHIHAGIRHCIMMMGAYGFVCTPVYVVWCDSVCIGACLCGYRYMQTLWKQCFCGYRVNKAPNPLIMWILLI